MIREDLPPAGNPVLWRSDRPQPQFPGYDAIWVSSGTAALALALIVAKRARPELDQPEVLLPAYGCPDLVAAAEYAGVRPVLVDIGRDDPGFDIDALVAQLSPRVVAVVAVNFLGICERLDALAEVLQAHPGVALIEDNAQWFPEASEGAPNIVGDMVCLSFGRGKPVSLLGGGGLLIRSDRGCSPGEISAVMNSGRLRLSTHVYNALLHPRLYPLVSRNPLLKLGQTRFKPLAEIAAMDAVRGELLGANVDKHLSRSRWRETLLREALVASGLSVVDLAASAGLRRKRLLRYPVLLPNGVSRDYVLHRLRHAGLGVTAMYQRALPDIEEVDARVELRGGVEHARQFASRLLTLPVHNGVTESHIRKIGGILKACATG